MIANPPFAAPVRMLLVALALCTIAAAAAVLGALRTPWLGLELRVDENTGAVVADARGDGPARALGTGAAGLTLAGPAEPVGMRIESDDLIEEPDFFDEYGSMNAFFARQGRLRALLDGPVEASWRSAAGEAAQAVWTPQPRPLSSLPARFWFQLAVSCMGCLIACWVWALRPADLGAGMFALTGLSFPAFALPAAVYSSRELALGAEVFRALSVANHAGALMFGCALLAVFLCYPRALARPAALWALPVVYGAWWLADTLQLLPSQTWVRLGILSEMLGAMVLAAIQWWRCRGQPLDRAALRWLALSMLVGSGLFVFSTIGSQVLGFFPPVSQGYAFGYFLIIYIGLALGLRRYRVFDLDRWAYRILLWLAGALAVVLMDAALIAWLRMNPAVSLGLTLLVCGWLYFPFRQWLWRRLTGAREGRVESAFPELIRIAFSASRIEQERRWDALLSELFDPLEIRPLAGANGQAALTDSGQMLKVPGFGTLRGRMLRLADRGRRLFAPRDVELAASLVSLMDKAAAGRDSYERGVREERHRIAQDMHDDIGARLLMLIHQAARAGDELAADVARAAMSDLRTTLSALEGRNTPLTDALADWRAEMAARCEAAGVAFGWDQDGADGGGADAIVLSARMKATLERVLREALSNALKHAQPARIVVRSAVRGDRLEFAVEDDGAAAARPPGGNAPSLVDEAAQRQEGRPRSAAAARHPEGAAPAGAGSAQAGRGLPGMRRRLAEYDGCVELESRAGGNRLCVSLSLARPAAGAPAGGATAPMET